MSHKAKCMDYISIQLGWDKYKLGNLYHKLQMKGSEGWIMLSCSLCSLLWFSTDVFGELADHFIGELALKDVH